MECKKPGRDEIEKIRTQLIGLEMEVRLLQLSIKAGFNPNQPRVPAGDPEGGQWIEDGRRSSRRRRRQTASGRHRNANRRTRQPPNQTNRPNNQQSKPAASSRHTVTLPSSETFVFETQNGVQTVYDDHGRAIASSRWTSSGPQSIPLVQQASSSALASQKAFEAGRRLYNKLSESPDRKSDELICLAFTAKEYRPGEFAQSLDFVGNLSREDTANICHRLDTVQTFIDEATAEARAVGSYPSAAAFGTAVHKRLEFRVNSLEDMTLRAERPLLGTLGFGEIRVDVIEDYGDGPICVYDLKTGRRGLSARRAIEFAKRLLHNRRPIVIIEMRPFE